MDRKSKRQAKAGSWRIPWTGWSLVRTQDVSKLLDSNKMLLNSNKIRCNIIRRLLAESEDRKVKMERWAMDHGVSLDECEGIASTGSTSTAMRDTAMFKGCKYRLTPYE